MRLKNLLLATGICLSLAQPMAALKFSTQLNLTSIALLTAKIGMSFELNHNMALGFSLSRKFGLSYDNSITNLFLDSSKKLQDITALTNWQGTLRYKYFFNGLLFEEGFYLTPALALTYVSTSKNQQSHFSSLTEFQIGYFWPFHKDFFMSFSAGAAYRYSFLNSYKWASPQSFIGLNSGFIPVGDIEVGYVF